MEPPEDRESLLIQNVPRNKGRAVVICGADDRGLMYGVLEVADHIRLSRDGSKALASISDAIEKPDVAVRSGRDSDSSAVIDFHHGLLRH